VGQIQRTSTPGEDQTMNSLWFEINNHSVLISMGTLTFPIWGHPEVQYWIPALDSSGVSLPGWWEVYSRFEDRLREELDL